MLIGLLIVLCVLAYVGYRLITARHNEEAAVDVAAPDSAAADNSSMPAEEADSWLSYYDNDAGFAVNYPADWTLNRDRQADQRLTLTSPETIKKISTETDSLLTDDISVSYFERVSDYAVSVDESIRGQAISLEAMLATYGDQLLVRDVTDVSVNHRPAKGLTISGEGDYYVVLIESAGHLYQIFFHRAATAGDLSPNEAKILDSFAQAV